MSRFELTILGCNSAMPAYDRFPTAQVLNIHDQLILIDCGEGTQIRMNQFKIKRNRIEHIFISHLHGDHVYGLAGLLTSYNHHGRTTDLVIYGPEGLEEMIRTQLKYTGNPLTYDLHFEIVDTTKSIEVLKTNQFKVRSIPLKHRIPTTGYLFTEVLDDRHLIPEQLESYDVPIEKYEEIKAGKDYVKGDQIVKNEILTRPSDPPRSFAYCSDTAYNEDIVEVIRGAELLYHEATFMHDLKEKADRTKHSTTIEAAEIARKAEVRELVIGHYSSRYHDLSPLLEEAKTVFPNTHLGIDGKTYEVRSAKKFS